MALDFYKYVDPAASPYWPKLETWIASLDPDRDEGERGIGGGPRSSLGWFFRNNFDATLAPEDIFGTYFGVTEEGEVVVTATLVRDDRDMLKTTGVNADGMWGLVVTHHDRRQRGYGGAMCRHLDQLCQELAEKSDGLTFALFTRYPPAVQIYLRLGFRRVRDVLVTDPGLTGGGHPFTEVLYTKKYFPTA